jgi:hypothetical protein
MRPGSARLLTLMGSGAVLAACGSSATALSAVPTPKAPRTVNPPLTAQDRAAEAAFRDINWSALTYPGLAPHCHPLTGPATQTGTVEGYVTGSPPLAIVSAQCANMLGNVPNGVYAFAPSSSGVSLVAVLASVPPSPLRRDPPNTIFYFETMLAGLHHAQAIPSPPGTTTSSPYTIAGPVIATVGCYPSQPIFASPSQGFTIVGLTDPNLQAPDNPPGEMVSLGFRLAGGVPKLAFAASKGVERYSCP